MVQRPRRTALFAALLLLSALLFACGAPGASTGEAALLGKWKGQIANVTVVLEFCEDGSYVMEQNAQAIRGTYTVSGDALTTTYQEETETEYYTLQDDTLTLSKAQGGDAGMILTRMK